MKKFAPLIFVAMCVSFPALAAKPAGTASLSPAAGASLSVQKNVTTISADREDLILFEKRKDYFWMDCLPRAKGYASGYKTITLGDTLRVQNYAITAGVILFVRHEEASSDILINKPLAAHATHFTDCYIAANEAELPNGSKCDCRFILIEGCNVIQE